jgi:uncharacterized membrane protein YfcA
MIRHFLSRIGCLMMIGGGIVLIVGVAALRSDHPAMKPLAIGALLFLFGFFLWSKLKKKPRRSTRFSIFRKRTREAQEDENEMRNGWND